jgi:hypothetical protein
MTALIKPTTASFTRANSQRRMSSYSAAHAMYHVLRLDSRFTEKKRAPV